MLVCLHFQWCHWFPIGYWLMTSLLWEEFILPFSPWPSWAGPSWYGIFNFLWQSKVHFMPAFLDLHHPVSQLPRQLQVTINRRWQVIMAILAGAYPFGCQVEGSAQMIFSSIAGGRTVLWLVTWQKSCHTDLIKAILSAVVLSCHKHFSITEVLSRGICRINTI